MFSMASQKGKKKAPEAALGMNTRRSSKQCIGLVMIAMSTSRLAGEVQDPIKLPMLIAFIVNRTGGKNALALHQFKLGPTIGLK